MRKKMCALLAILLLTACSSTNTESEIKNTITKEQSLVNTIDDDFDYFVKSELNDTGVYFYDLYNNEGKSQTIGDVVFTIEIVDPVYYGKQRTGVLEQIQNMAHQLDLENQANGMYSDVELIGEDGKTHLYTNTLLFYSVKYKNIEGTDWAFLMSNNTCDGVHNNAIMGVAQFNDRWIVMNLTSSFSNDSPSIDLNKAVYYDFYNSYELQDCVTLEQLMSLN